MGKRRPRHAISSVSDVDQGDATESSVTKGGSRLNLSRLAPAELRKLQERFAVELSEYLQSSDDGQQKDQSKEALLARVSKDFGHEIDVRSFDKLLKLLYVDEYLKVGFRRLHARSAELGTKFNGPHFSVVAGNSEENFAEAAAEELIRELHRIGEQKARQPRNNANRILNVGIVSGSTTGAVIRAATAIESWSRHFGIDWTRLPTVRIFALNVCLTVPKHVDGNSTILSYNLYEKIRRECKGQVEVEPYGLSAPLLVKRAQLAEIDQEPQTFDVVRHTEPFRVREKLTKLGDKVDHIEQATTELDIVLTGVGEKPPTAGTENVTPSGGSIFYNLATQFDFKMDVIVRENRVVGDIAFTAIRSDGEGVPLTKESAESLQTEAPARTEYVFYSAVGLHVLEAMARDPAKAVILVARHAPDKDKVPAIFASITRQQGPYASKLVVDETTAERLLHF